MGATEAFDLFQEAEALSTLVKRVTDPHVSIGNAIDFVSRTFPLEGESAEASLMNAAMAKILLKNIPDPDFPPVSGPGDQQEFASLTRAWIHWAKGDLEEASQFLQTELPLRGGSALHLMTLRPWREAIHALITGSKREASRYFLRTMEMGCQIGTETNSAIQWSYVASFFHR